MTRLRDPEPLTVSSYLVMMLDAHADGVDEDGDHDAPAEVLALHDAPQFPPHILPDLPAVSEARPLLLAALILAAALLPSRLLHRVLLVLLPVHRVPHISFPLFQGAHGAVLGILRDRQADGVGQWLGAVVLLALVRAVGGWTDWNLMQKFQKVCSKLSQHVLELNKYCITRKITSVKPRPS